MSICQMGLTYWLQHLDLDSNEIKTFFLSWKYLNIKNRSSQKEIGVKV